MKSIRILIILCTTLMVSCDQSQPDIVTKVEDYEQIIQQSPESNTLYTDVAFWTTKINTAPNQFPYYVKRAGAYSKCFSTIGKIDDLINAESDLIKANEMTSHNNASILRALAANYISQHRFKEALEALERAEENGKNLMASKKMLFDAHLELGNYDKAQQYLVSFKNTSDFDYLIRRSKWEDHIGNLDNAIRFMERALKIAESSNIAYTKQWAYTNLADFYGHAGRIQESYELYLKALELDPHDAYAKKGIAWILYSYEKNTDEALRIMNHITQYHNAPDNHLLISEIAEFKNDIALKDKALETYKDVSNNDMYGAMYNKYNVLLYTEPPLITTDAIELAKTEVENRPTPESYDLLAWSYFKAGQLDEALTIVETKIEGFTYEPTILYHVAEIYKAVGKQIEVDVIKEELLASLYELGPTMEDKIKQL